MATEGKGRDLFIVDNSVSGWTALRYLEEWCSIARAFDIATGYFEIGALLALEGKWQGLEKIRVLMGSETTHRTRDAIRQAVVSRATSLLDASIERDKTDNPFLKGVPAIIDALKSGLLECRVYDRDKFHAKAYITHAKLEVVGSQALVGSSNFTNPGLTTNIELNVQIQSAREVAQLQEWFETHWKDASVISDAIITTIERQARQYTPFDVYARALREYFRGHELTATEWDETKSKVFKALDRYQKEAYWALMKIARQYGGAFLCDGVGLGKTFVGLMLIERLVLHEGKNVVLFAPKAAKESVWEPHLAKWLSHVGGAGASTDFSNLAVFSHTDLSRPGDFPERFRRIAQMADVVIVDEAHHFRNPGSAGNEAEGVAPSRYHRLYEVLDNSHRPKTLFMLTATPINNRLADFRHMAELFTRKDDTFFGKTLGVNSLTSHFNAMERALSATQDNGGAVLTESMPEAKALLDQDPVFRQLVVQRSRAYARESQLREAGLNAQALFPQREPPKVADYSIRKTYGRLLDMFEAAFKRRNPLFTLPMYYPLAWYRGEDKSIDPLEEGRQQQIVGLIRTNFLKRFESSVVAFELSCDRLLRKLLAFIQVHSETEAEKRRLEKWKIRNAEVLEFATQFELNFGDPHDDEDMDGDVVSQDLLDEVRVLSRAEYDVVEMIQETFDDLDQIVQFLVEAKQFEPRNDDKLQKLIRLLKSRDLGTQKVLVFTEFKDTARYIKRELDKAQVSGVEQIDSGTERDRAEVIRCFAPYYNGTSSAQVQLEGHSEIRILVSTDVLSEGLNLQDALRMINYDIHWNPVRLMQRIGRVDRRMSKGVEEAIKRDHPNTAPYRGKIAYWNFLPPDELDALLSLYRTVTRKTLLISKTLGIEGRQLLRPDDAYDAIREFNHAYEGTKSVLEEMHLEYQALVEATPGLESYLAALPGAIYSGRIRSTAGKKGLFFCYALPALDTQRKEFTEEAGIVRWYFLEDSKSSVIEEPQEILASVRSVRDTPRVCRRDEASLLESRAKVEKHIKNSYLKRLDAPVGVRPVLKCWMELVEE